MIEILLAVLIVLSVILVFAIKAYKKSNSNLLTLIGIMVSSFGIFITAIGLVINVIDKEDSSLHSGPISSLLGSLFGEDKALPEGGSHQREFNGHKYCICIRSDIDSFKKAEEECEKSEGHLAVINDEEENAFLYNTYITELGAKSAYFGYTNENNGDIWYWVGKTLPADENGYTNWAENEPYDKGGEHYALFWYKDEEYKWNSGDFGKDPDTGVVNFLVEWD